MSEMGEYCKAYLAEDFRRFDGWTENAENMDTELVEEDGQEEEVQREITDDTVLYLQENYVVTDGIYKDEHVIFDDVTDEWKQFCEDELGFEVPDFEPIDVGDGASDGEVQQGGEVQQATEQT
jgi:hypothetical protein